MNGLLAGAEIAVVSVRRSRLRELASAGSAAARAAEALRQDPESFLATVQIGITVVGAAAGAFGGAAFAADLEPVVRSAGFLAPYAREIAFAVVVATIAYLSVVLGELVPKSLALRSSELFALAAARPLLVASRIARPAVWLLAASSNGVLRLFGDRTSFTESRVSADEIRRLVEDAARTGDVDPAAGDIAARALGFASLDAEDVMVHRRFVVSVPAGATRGEARRVLVDAGHDRAPVVDPQTNEAIGYVTLRDLAAAEGDGDGAARPCTTRPVYYVPESMSAVLLLRELQRRRTQIAVVVDEHGGTVGIVTLRDLLEELVGELLGEHEVRRGSRIRREPGGSALVEGMVPIHEVDRELGTRLPDDAGATTLGGLCSALAGGRMPDAGEVIRAPDGTALTPIDVSPRRVRLVRVRPRAAGEPDAPAEDRGEG